MTGETRRRLTTRRFHQRGWRIDFGHRAEFLARTRDSDGSKRRITGRVDREVAHDSVLDADPLEGFGYPASVAARPSDRVEEDSGGLAGIRRVELERAATDPLSQGLDKLPPGTW